MKKPALRIEEQKPRNIQRADIAPSSGYAIVVDGHFKTEFSEESAAHFVKSDVPLLVSFVQVTVLARRATKRPGLLAAFERAVKLQATLATRLRLAPQARITTRTAGRFADAAIQGPAPWVRS